MVASRVRQVVVVYRNDCIGIGSGGPNVGRHRRVVFL